MALRVEFLGTAGAIPIPRPLCTCRICTKARAHGIPYARSGPSVFVHGPDVLIDTPGEIVDQLNRSSVDRIAACFYSHWHPDHTMGRHVFSLLNSGFPSWPYEPRATTPVYLPQQVAVDACAFLGIRDHLAEMEDEGVVAVHELRDGDVVEFGGARIRPIRLAQDFVYAFLLEDGAKRLLIVMDELEGWNPPDWVRGVDLAIVPMGLVEVDPLSGERRVAAGHPVLRAEATFEEALDVVRRLGAKRTVMSHIEETDGLGHDDLVGLSVRLAREGVDVTFAHDTLIVDVD